MSISLARRFPGTWRLLILAWFWGAWCWSHPRMLGIELLMLVALCFSLCLEPVALTRNLYPAARHTAPLYEKRIKLFTELVACHVKAHFGWHAGQVAPWQTVGSVRPGLVDRARQYAVGAGLAAAGRIARVAAVVAQ